MRMSIYVKGQMCVKPKLIAFMVLKNKRPGLCQILSLAFTSRKIDFKIPKTEEQKLDHSNSFSTSNDDLTSKLCPYVTSVTALRSG